MSCLQDIQMELSSRHRQCVWRPGNIILSLSDIYSSATSHSLFTKNLLMTNISQIVTKKGFSFSKNWASQILKISDTVHISTSFFF